MKYAVIAVLLLVALGIAWSNAVHGATPTPAATKYPDYVYVNIQGGAFVPDNVTIAKGGYVIWTNTDNATNSLKWDGYEKQLGKGGALTRTFEKTGVYKVTNGMSPNRTTTVIVK